LESPILLPQINGSKNLAFEAQLRKIIFAYKNIGGLSAFYNDLKTKGIPSHLEEEFAKLAKIINHTITKMPMRYIGNSLGNGDYSIFNYESCKSKRISRIMDVEYLIMNFGTFSMPIDYYEAFKVLGSFINGQDSILFKWAEFSVNASGNNNNIEKTLSEVLRSPITERDIEESKKLYKSILNKEGKVKCVWTGESIATYDVDHVIPFSVWKNNDLWNLLPAHPTFNNRKRNKIPAIDLIEKQKYLILHYWEIIHENEPHRFEKEIQISLLGNYPFCDWKKIAINQLQKSCIYLINTRGNEEWKI
jgi:hypothetical protein